MKEIHLLFLNSGKSFKEMVSQECGYSEATFYRKLAFFNRLSNTEKQKFLEVAEKLVNGITNCINRHRDQ